MYKSINLLPKSVAPCLIKRAFSPLSFPKISLLLSLGIVFILATGNNLSAQNCYFDENLHGMMSADHLYVQQLEINESKIQDMISGNPQAIMNSVVYTIPVVFHVIHLGESVGTGSNISDSQLLQALADLNYDFRNIGGAGTDVEIEFCLAKRKPDGSPSTGINRVNGYGVGNYQSIGMASSNEVALKALSIWPNRDYLNIWIVDYIASGNTGFATFPGTSSAVDGIVLWSGATGVSGFSHVITHEAGHFLNLYHTFEGGDASNCPPNADCLKDGDRVCDTPPHLQPGGGCVTTGTACDGTTPIADVAHNYMNYTSNSCRDRFTPRQVARMRTALMVLRHTLIYSLGCEPGCTSVTADYTVPQTEIPILTTLTFTNTSSGSGLTYSWLINGEEIDTTTDFVYSFNDVGYWDVCLDATDTSGCTNRKCDTISVYLTCPLPESPCEKVINGEFDYIEPSGTGNEAFNDVCAWQSTFSSPFYCIGTGNNSIGLLFRRDSTMDDFERVTSRYLLDLDSNSRCRISFDYLVTNNDLSKIIIALSDTKTYGHLPGNATVIAQVVEPESDYSPQVNNECYDENYSFHHHEEDFYFHGDEGLYLNITGEKNDFDSLPAIIFIDNISINCCGNPTPCVPEPSFTDTLRGCSATFTGTNTGDPGFPIWDFGDGSTDTGLVVTHQYLWGDTFTVCLTIKCPDMETTQTICHDIIIPDSCNRCDTLPGVRASRCDTSESWITSFCFQIPKGFKPCKDNDLFVSSPEVIINVLSYEITPYDAHHDQVCVALEITSPSGYNFEMNGATGYISLCSNGEIPMICRIFTVGAYTCGICQSPISNTAVCNDPNLNDNLHIYRGSINLTLTSSGATYCGVVSSEAGFAVDPGTITNTGTHYTVPYSFITNNNNLANFKVVLCFYDNDNQQIVCVPVNITLPICDTLPSNCAMEWSVKNMACSGSDGGNLVIFNFAMSVNVANLELCNGGLFGTVDGGIVDVLSPSPTLLGGVLTFNVNMVIPCDSFVSGNVYEMRLYLCSEEGELTCLLFPFRLFCEDCEKTELRAQPIIVNPKSKTIDQYRIVPNPATDKISILIMDFDAEKRQEARLFNQLGRLVKSLDLTSNKTEIDISQSYPGIYYLVISNNGVLVKSEKVIIIR